jgi:hypothetical protein
VRIAIIQHHLHGLQPELKTIPSMCPAALVPAVRFRPGLIPRPGSPMDLLHR